MSTNHAHVHNAVRSHAKKRRTFAIISHPDAGKTTVTEKLLLYSGMVRTAGMVGSRKKRQERGVRLDGRGTRTRDFDYGVSHAVPLQTGGHQPP